MLRTIKRAIILRQRLQTMALWLYTLGTMLLTSLVLCFFVVWVCCFFVHLYYRVMQLQTSFSMRYFHSIWLACSLGDCVLTLRCDFARIKYHIDYIYCLDSRLCTPYNWNYLSRWANTPSLIIVLTELGFRETTIGLPNLVLDMAFGQFKEPCWTNVRNYIAGGKVWEGSVQYVSLIQLNYFKDCLTLFVHEPWPLITAVAAAVLKIDLQQWYYGIDSGDSGQPDPWVLAEIVWIPTMILSIMLYTYSFAVGVLIPIMMAYQNYKGWRQNSLGMALWDVAVGITYALVTRLTERVYNYFVFGRYSLFNWMFLYLVALACFVLMMTRSYAQKARNWEW